MNILDLNNLEKEDEPKFFVVSALIKKNGKVSKLFLYAGIHHSLREAQYSLINEIKTLHPDLWSLALKNGGVQFNQSKVFGEIKLKSEFNKYKKKEVKQKVDNHNRLMQELIKKGDLYFADKYRDQLSEFDIRYIKDKITKNKGVRQY